MKLQSNIASTSALGKRSVSFHSKTGLSPIGKTELTNRRMNQPFNTVTYRFVVTEHLESKLEKVKNLFKRGGAAECSAECRSDDAGGRASVACWKSYRCCLLDVM